LVNEKSDYCHCLYFAGSIVVVQLTRFSNTQTAVVFEWLAVFSLAFFVLICIWAGGKYIIVKKVETVSRVKSGLEAAEFGISKREMEVLKLVAEGFSNRQISEKLFVSESTIKKHVSNVLGKLSASRRTEAVRIAFQMNILSSRDTADPA
jgi:DNA-binding CsgD family transcriptional regulator